MTVFFDNLHLRWQDLVDIGLLTIIFYRMLLLIKGTRTMPMLMGFFLILALYLMSQILQLDAMGLLLDNLASSLVLVLVVLFQSDIRNALAQFGLMALFSDSTGQIKKGVLNHSLQACLEMSRQRIGALIVFEREVGLRNFYEKGTQLNATVSEELLLSIFHPTSPLHDGAVIINKKGQLLAARCILPVSMNRRLNPILGTRHRAAIGLTEETDAVVLIVSEERSEISLSYKGELFRESEENIRQILNGLVLGSPSESSDSDMEQKLEQKKEQKMDVPADPMPILESAAALAAETHAVTTEDKEQALSASTRTVSR